ncbi:MAG TPA: glycoside hydrolase family 2 TIM barrel-domain containing protein [Polyangiaceae bacterium]|jgi:hypothetical protein|nr:glycoside hydrolase family 2 TIM barrel-domain containing protein [Polyangiaceae bacterium]
MTRRTKAGFAFAAGAGSLLALACGSSSGSGAPGGSGNAAGMSASAGSNAGTGAGSNGTSGAGGANAGAGAGAGASAGVGGTGSGTGGASGSGGGAGMPSVGPMVPVCPTTGLAGAGQVAIVKSGAMFTLTRDGAPYYIKGIAGSANLALAQQAGVNSTRSYSSGNAARLLDSAKSHCMTVMLGVDLSQNPADYANSTWTSGKVTEVTNLLATVKSHPALLVWALGNEINLGADTQTAWAFVEQLSQMIHAQDTNHPVISVLAGADVTALNHIVTWAPSLDAVGANSYAPIVHLNTDVDSSNFSKAVIVTEWGPTGAWESPMTSWARPIEDTSGAKMRVFKTRYDTFAHTGRILGDYVFLWGQKIETTPTWYGMFLETSADLGLAGESLPTVDTMTLEWSGAYPVNRAPDVTALTLDGKAAADNVTLSAGQSVQAQVTVSDPEGDSLSYAWEILQDPAQVNTNGVAQMREPRVGTPQKGTSPTLSVTLPSPPGQYRLFVYVLDGKGHAGTANIPFLVQ